MGITALHNCVLDNFESRKDFKLQTHFYKTQCLNFPTHLSNARALSNSSRKSILHMVMIIMLEGKEEEEWGKTITLHIWMRFNPLFKPLSTKTYFDAASLISILLERDIIYEGPELCPEI